MELCRAITFINDHIPIPEEPDRSEVEYATVGFFDGMITEPIEIQDTSNELKNLWKYGLQCISRSMGKYSFQNIFCFSRDEWNECKDELIWSEEVNKRYPLTFVVFLQLKEYLDGENAIAQQCMAFNQAIQQTLRDQGLYYSYCTVDKNDFVICVKSLSYALAVDAIKSLHQTGREVIYSYTVFSVSYKTLAALNKKEYEAIYEETIKSICLKGITNSFDFSHQVWLDQKYNEFGEQLVDRLYEGKKEEFDYKIYDILGDDDFRLIARDVKLGRLLEQLAKGGMLCNQGSKFRDYLFSSTLVLNTETPEERKVRIDEVYFEKNSEQLQMACRASTCEQLEHRVKHISDIISKPEVQPACNEKVITFCSAILQLLHSLKALEIAPTKKYDFWSLYDPLSLMIDILEEKMERFGGDGEICELGDSEELFEFIHKISMTLHGTLRTDIQFFQIKDFNATVHYAPAKLRAFYSLWALELSNYYNGFCGKKNQYSFIFSPGMFPIVSVKQLFMEYKATKRLMLITVPERLLYSPRWLSIVLAHEASHFVGYQVRQRQRRHEAWLMSCARLLFLEMNHYRYRICEEEWKEELEAVLAKSDLYEILKIRLSEEERCIRAKRNLWPHEFHSQNSIGIIRESFRELARNGMEKLVADDCEKIIRDLRSLSKYKKCSPIEQMQANERIREIVYEAERSLRYIYQRFQMKLAEFLNIFKHIMVEACADINAVLTLELDPEEYLLSFSGTELYFGKAELGDQEALPIIVRLALVLTAIKNQIPKAEEVFKEPGFPAQWTRFEIGRFAVSQSENSVEEEIALGIYSYTQGIRNCNLQMNKYKNLFDASFEIENFRSEQMDFLNDREIWDSMRGYVESSVEEYLRILKDNAPLISKKKELAGTYKRIAKGSAIDLAQEMETFLNNFEKSCKTEAVKV